MESTIQVLKNHHSVRTFKSEEDINEHMMEDIISSAMAAPNWVNGQQVSVIEVRNTQKKLKLAQAAGNQVSVEEAPVFLVFCIDFYRAKLAADKNGTDFRIIDDLEAVIIGSTDVGIALGSAVIAAESLGLGTVPIGGIRRNSQTVIDLLELPEYVFPISGLAMGYSNAMPGNQKPRLPLEATYSKEVYNTSIQKDAIDRYDKTLASYYLERSNGKESSNWSGKLSLIYDTGFEQYRINTSSTIKKQGFTYS